VTQTLPDGSSVVLANATMFSYPLRFDGGALECPPAVLDQLSKGGYVQRINPTRDYLVASSPP
jgi:hypothetical protein